MAIVRTRNLPTPFAGRSLLDEFDRMFNEVTSPVYGADTPRGSFAADLYETEDAVVLEMAVPGLTAEELDISVEGRTLTLTASLPERESEGRRYLMQGIVRGDLNRTLRLPRNVDTDAIEATVSHGMLTLHMPKVAEAKVRKIQINNA